MNILEKLKNMPTDTHLWSPAFGNVFLDKVDEDDQYPIGIKFYNRAMQEWEKDGLSRKGSFEDYDGAECIIFPSQQMQEWDLFFQPGEVVQRIDGDKDAPAMLLFDRWVHNDYTTFIGKYYAEDGYWAIYKAHTEDYRRAFKEDADRFLKASRKQEQKGTKQAPPFKPFDKVLVRDTPTDNWMPAFFSYVMNGRTDITYMTLSGEDYYECIPYAGNEHLLGTADSPSNGKEAIL